VEVFRDMCVTKSTTSLRPRATEIGTEPLAVASGPHKQLPARDRERFCACCPH
jgi:hypothetical protein